MYMYIYIYKCNLTPHESRSHLWVDGSMVVDNSGHHAVITRSGTVHLSAGYHALRADWYQSRTPFGPELQTRNSG